MPAPALRTPLLVALVAFAVGCTGVGGPKPAGPTVTWVGHATLLVQLDGVNVLTDPQWSERARPFSFAGPKRFTPPALAFEHLPPIHAVVISHDHYDHLDVAASGDPAARRRRCSAAG